MKEQAPSSAAATAVNNVAGLDVIDGTPVLDIQPVMREFLPLNLHASPEWRDRSLAPLVAGEVFPSSAVRPIDRAVGTSGPRGSLRGGSDTGCSVNYSSLSGLSAPSTSPAADQPNQQRKAIGDAVEKSGAAGRSA